MAEREEVLKPGWLQAETEEAERLMRIWYRLSETTPPQPKDQSNDNP